MSLIILYICCTYAYTRNASLKIYKFIFILTDRYYAHTQQNETGNRHDVPGDTSDNVDHVSVINSVENIGNDTSIVAKTDSHRMLSLKSEIIWYN